MLLTDEEITAIVRECARGSAINRDGSTSHRIARAVITAYEAKLREQKPVAWMEFPEGSDYYFIAYSENKAAKTKPLFAHPAPTHEGWTAIHLKTGNEYQVIGEAIDATNMHSNQLMVIYQRDGKTFVREAEEFQEKFKAAARSGE